MRGKEIRWAWLVATLLGVSACQAQALPTPTATALPPATAAPATVTVVSPPTNTPPPPVPSSTRTATATPSTTWTVTATPSASPTPTPTAVIYVVKQADTLFDIAAQFHIDVGALAAANQLTTTILSVGQQLTIPSREFATPTPSPIPSGLPAGTKIRYKVLLGDTLESIAAKFNSTVDAISKANPDPGAPQNPFRHLTDQNLQAELVIVVPINVATPMPTATAPRG